MSTICHLFEQKYLQQMPEIANNKKVWHYIQYVAKNTT